jgi:hypothetical protein
MNVTTVLRPAQKILTGAVLAAVAGTCLHAQAVSAGDAPAVVRAKKEVVVPFKKEAARYTLTAHPGKKEGTPLKKEAMPLKKESAPLKKEGRL